MSDKKTWPQAIVDAFQDLVIFMCKRWVAAIFTTLFIIFIAGVSLGVFYLYVNMKKGVNILEDTHTTREDLQTNLIDSVENNMLIDKELSRLMICSKNGMSAMFFKFHNSKIDLQGKHNFYYSGNNEISRNSRETFMTTVQDIPITRLGGFMVPFINNQCQFVEVASNLEDTWLMSRFKTEGIICLASCPVYDFSNKFLLGFVELVYTENGYPVRTHEQIMNDLETSANKISVIISNGKIK